MSDISRNEINRGTASLIVAAMNEVEPGGLPPRCQASVPRFNTSLGAKPLCQGLCQGLCQASIPSLDTKVYAKFCPNIIYKMREINLKDLVPGETYYIENPRITAISRPIWEHVNTYSNSPKDLQKKKDFIDSASNEKIIKYGFINDYKYESGKKIGVFNKYIIKNNDVLHAKFTDLRDLPGAKLKSSGFGSNTTNEFDKSYKYYEYDPELREKMEEKTTLAVLRSITGDPNFDPTSKSLASTKGGKSKKSITKRVHTMKRRNKMRGKKTN